MSQVSPFDNLMQANTMSYHGRRAFYPIVGTQWHVVV